MERALHRPVEMKPSTESVKSAFVNLMAKRDDARVRLHLLSMDGRKKWNELEEKLSTLEHDLGERAGKAVEEQSEHVKDLATRFRTSRRSI